MAGEPVKGKPEDAEDEDDRDGTNDTPSLLLIVYRRVVQVCVARFAIPLLFRPYPLSVRYTLHVHRLAVSQTVTENQTFFAMVANGEALPPLSAPSALPTIPSEDEARRRYLCCASHPRFIARSSLNPWVAPPADDEDPDEPPMGCRAFSHSHPLNDIWNHRNHALAEEIMEYLRQEKVDFFSIIPIRFGSADLWGAEGADPILLLSVKSGSMDAERGIKIALGLRAIIVSKGIEDIHVEIVEAER